MKKNLVNTKYFQVKARLDKMEKEYSIASKDLTLKSAQLQQAVAEREDATKKFIDLQQVAEILKMDKVYLAKEAENAKSRVMIKHAFLTGPRCLH